MTLLACVGAAHAQNIIQDGDFSLGNTNFSSDYSYVAYDYTNYTQTPQVVEGDYTVGPYVPPSYGDWAPFQTVSGGSSQMLIANGAPDAAESIWAQLVAVLPNTTYTISFYLAEVSAPTIVADIAVVLGTNQIGDATAPSVIDTWQQYSFSWNSGKSTNVLLALKDLQTSGSFNDFAIDNISMSEAGTPANTNPPVIVAEPTNQTVTAGSPATFTVSATGAAPLEYQWLFNTTDLTNNAQTTGSQSNVLTLTGVTMSNAGTYHVVVRNAYGSAIGSAALTVLAQSNTFLPVYQAITAGATPERAENLANILKIPLSQLVQSNGMISFVATDFMSVPTTPVTNATVIRNLLAVTKNPYPAIPISFQAVDFAALSNLTVLGTAAALSSASNALGSAGLTPQFGRPVIGHTLLNAFCTNDDNSVSWVSRYLDTAVNYQFTDPNGFPIIGPGQQVQFSYGGAGNVTHLLYSARQLTAGPAVQIIPLTEASNRVANVLPANSHFNLQLAYWSPPLQPWPSPRSAWNPRNIIPWYVVNATILATNPATGSNYTSTLEGQMIPATDDTNFVPSVSLSASAPENRQIIASVLASGGRPPYTYLWAGSNPAVSTNTGASINYTPKVRVALPPLAITFPTVDTVRIYWPYPSTGFVCESTTNLATTAWSQVAGPVQTNNGLNSVAVNTPPSGAAFFRLRLASQTLPVIESVAVTVTDADGVWVQTNQSIAVQAEAIPATGGDPTYGTESPYDVNGFDVDRWSWESTMSLFGGGLENFSWTQYNSWPGDYVEPVPPDTWQAILSNPAAGPALWADADVAGVNTADLVMYFGHAGTQNFTFTWPDGPLTGSPDYGLSLNNPGYGMAAAYGDNSYTWNLDLTSAWGNIGPSDTLNWLCFFACEMLQWNQNNPNDLSFSFGNFPNAIYAYQRWGGAFNGLHSMLGFQTVYNRPSVCPNLFAASMLTGSTIVSAWLSAGNLDWPTVQLNPFQSGFGIFPSVPAAMGPFGPGGVSDINDYYPGKGSMGPSIPPPIRGWWYMAPDYSVNVNP